MQKITYSLIAAALTLGLGSARTARADDAFTEAQDDAPAAHVEQETSRLPFALAPDAQDDSGLSARSFQPRSDAPAFAGAIGVDPYDDAGISASHLEPQLPSGA